MGLSGETFMRQREEEFNNMPNDMRAAEYFEEMIRTMYGEETAKDFHAVIEKAKAKNLLNNGKPTIEDLDNLFTLDED